MKVLTGQWLVGKLQEAGFLGLVSANRNHVETIKWTND